ncbi:hypothetical protein FB548_3254 [Pseudoxanthomonas sp. 3HH-4]|nr:hypothetical protein FB548_3254 [Pseudoxanthomonas sp. 3HH-4]
MRLPSNGATLPPRSSRTTYPLDADTLHLTDEVRGKEEHWKAFGRSRLQRSEETTGDDDR